jgi:glyoxylase-like metal-dependent hydrolase (beta-lactamase superfamily II)
MPDQPKVERFEASNDAVIYRLPLEVFSGYIAYAHLVMYQDLQFLVDVGSGFGSSHKNLVTRFDTLRNEFGVNTSFEKLDYVIITHGHVDHFGGLNEVKQQAPQAKVAIHELDRPVLINYDERVLRTRRGMAEFIQHSGVPEERSEHLMQMYMLGKRAFKSIAVDKTLRDGDLLESTLSVIHVPGHTPGLIMLQVGDILLTADHLLPGTSVALAPESLMPYTGVGHYLESLLKAGGVEGVRVALGGHEWAMEDYYEVAQHTYTSSLEKIERVLSACGEPRTIYELACEIYGSLEGYSELLKLEQTGARIEYLNERGLVMIYNLEELESDHTSVLRYKRV